MYIKVLLIEENSYNIDNIKSTTTHIGINANFEILQIKDDINIMEVLSNFNPHILLIFNMDKFVRFKFLRIQEQEKCLIVSKNTPESEIGDKILDKYISLLKKSNNKTFSVITPLYKSPVDKLERLYKSLTEQTYNNWEWIVFDDSPQNHINSYHFINQLSKKDNRVSLYKRNKNSGIIGEVKNMAFSLGSGDFLVEVDHDDQLINTCLENLLVGYNYSDDIGFVYGHTCEQYENSNEIIDYGNNWAFNYGTYIETIYKNKDYKVAIAPNVNSKTIRGIVGIPNHVRSWRKDFYHQIGGHSKILHVADDYELFIRTFLHTKIARIDAFTYIQYFEKNSINNTQFNRNGEIQRLVHKINSFYNNDIHHRFLELNVDDFSWKENGFDLAIPNPKIETYSNIIIPIELLKNKLVKTITVKIN